MINHYAVWCISALTILLILVRPWQVAEAVWACSGAALLILVRAVSPAEAFSALGRGTDVYLFLTGMMLLSELARREGLFDWIATVAVQKAAGSQKRLFLIIYLVGVVVTAFLSNDATAVVLTPAVLAVVKKARATPLPYLLICAFIANAASFVLPISNPANLVIYASKMPPLLVWLRTFALPSAAAIVATYLVLRLLTRKDLAGGMESNVDRAELSPAGKWSAYGIIGTAIALLAASFLNLDLGLPTFLAALAAALLVALKDHDALLGSVKEISWSVLPLVGGLFIMVEAVNRAGGLAAAQQAIHYFVSLPALQSALSSSFAVAILSNVVNNLPVGLIAGRALQDGASTLVRDAVLIGVDLGPNLSVTGSLATILWLVAIRREGENVSAWQFLKFGAFVMPSALALAVLSLLLTAK